MWMAYMKVTHAGKEEKNKAKADSWLKTLMYTLQRGTKSDAQLKAEAAARAAFLNEKLGQGEAVYRMLIQKDSSDQVLRKTELAAVFPTDTELFDRIDKSEDGQITLEEWLGFLRTTHAVMEENEMESGDRWLENIIEALRLACMGKAERDAQEAAREIEIEELRKGLPHIEQTPTAIEESQGFPPVPPAITDEPILPLIAVEDTPPPKPPLEPGTPIEVKRAPVPVPVPEPPKPLPAGLCPEARERLAEEEGKRLAAEQQARRLTAELAETEAARQAAEAARRLAEKQQPLAKAMFNPRPDRIRVEQIVDSLWNGPMLTMNPLQIQSLLSELLGVPMREIPLDHEDVVACSGLVKEELVTELWCHVHKILIDEYFESHFNGEWRKRSQAIVDDYYTCLCVTTEQEQIRQQQEAGVLQIKQREDELCRQTEQARAIAALQVRLKLAESARMAAEEKAQVSTDEARTKLKEKAKRKEQASIIEALQQRLVQARESRKQAEHQAQALRREDKLRVASLQTPPEALSPLRSLPKQQHSASVFVVGSLVQAPAGSSSVPGLAMAGPMRISEVGGGLSPPSQHEVRVRNAALRASESRVTDQSLFKQGVQELDDMIQEFRGKYKRPAR